MSTTTKLNLAFTYLVAYVVMLMVLAFISIPIVGIVASATLFPNFLLCNKIEQ